MPSVGTLTANLVANTMRFTRPLNQAQQEIDSFNSRVEKTQKRLESVSKAGRVAGLAFGALTAALGVGARKAADYGDKIDKMAIRTGLGREQLQELQHVANTTGVNFDSLTRATIRLGQNLLDAEGKTGGTASIIERLGIQIRDSSGNVRDMDDLFGETIEALSRMDNEVERNTAALRLLGRQGQELIPILDAGGAEVDRLRREARELGLVMGETAIRDLSDFNTEMSVTTQRVGAAGREVVMMFLPALRVVLDWVNRGVDWFRNLSTEQMNNIKRWVSLAAVILGLVAVFGILTKAIVFVIGIFKTIGTVYLFIKGIITTVGAVLGGISASALLWFGLIAVAVGLLYLAWRNNWFGIRDTLTQVWEQHIKPILDLVIEFGAKTLSTAWNWLVQAVGDFWIWLKDTAWPWLFKVGETTWDWTFKAFGTFWTWLKDTAWPWLFKAGKTTWDWSFKALGSFWEWLTEKAIPWIEDTVTTSWNWTFKAFGTLWDWLQKGAGWIGDTVSTTIEFGQKGLGGIQRGINTVKGWLGFQSGGILPGFSGPDSIPALLAPGEAVIPGDIWRKGLGAVAEWFRRMGVPRFQEGGIAGGGGGLLGQFFPDFSTSIQEQGGVIKAMSNFVNGIPQMIINGLFGFFDGLIGVVEMLATTVLGEEEAARITGTLKNWQGEMRRLLGTLGFFDEELDEAAEETKRAAKEAAEAARLAATRVNLFSEMIEFAWVGLRENVPLLNRALSVFEASIEAVTDDFGEIIRQGMTPMQALAMVGLDLVMQSESFQRVLTLINPILEAVADAFGMLLDPLLPVVQVISGFLLPMITVLGNVIGSLLVPAMQILFPIIKAFGLVVLSVAQIIGRVWNTLLDLISMIPFVNLRKYKVDIENLSNATSDLASLTWDEARERAKNTEAIEESTRAMVNVPQIFRIALRRAEVSDMPSQIVPMQSGGIVRRPTIGLIGEAGPEAVIPLREGGLGEPVTIEVNINGPIFGMNDFRRAIEEAMSRAARSAGLAEFGTVVKFT